MKVCVYLVILLLTNTLIAAQASWSGIRVMHVDGYGDYRMEYSFNGYVDSGEGATGSLVAMLYGHEESGEFRLKSFDYTTVDVPVKNTWYLALYADVINSETIGSATQIELCNYGSEFNGGVAVNDRQDFYLVFETSEYGVDNGMTWYGWARVSVDDDFRMSILDADIGLYGESIVVGARSVIPEPSGSVLFLLGGALLALRRRIGGVSGNRSSIGN